MLYFSFSLSTTSEELLAQLSEDKKVQLSDEM